MKKLIIIIVVLVAVGVGAGAYYLRRSGPEPKVDTLQVTRGDIADVVLSTGTLQAVTTVNVGTQVSGMVQELYADFNSIVKKGQVIARLDPSLIQTSIEQRRASVTRAEAEIERLKVNLADAQRKLTQARQMWEKQLIPRDQLETAEMNVKTLDVQIRSSEAGLVQAKADLNTQLVNMQHTVITSPIDGIVISREVEPGRTVAASMNAPTLFIIAGDLSKMQVIANIDEADVGRMRQGQPVTFRVDAFPNDVFRGTVEQVRLQPTTVQNVVTYSTVIAVPNPELKLKPGMTANVTVEIARRSNVLRLPAAALRFRPTAEHFAALNLPVPPEIANRGSFARGGREGSGGGATGGGTEAPAQPSAGRGAAQASNAPSQPGGARGSSPRPEASSRESRSEAASRGGGDTPASSVSRGGRGQGPAAEAGGSAENRAGSGERRGFDPNMTPEERRKRMEERLAQMSPEERERWEQRMREGGFGRRSGGGGAPGSETAGGGRGGGSGQTAANRQGSAPSPGAGGRGQGPGDPAAARQSRADSARWDARQGITARASGGASISSGATTIDALFAPLVIPERPGMVWLWADKQLKPLRVRYGISDGTWNEIVEGDLQEGQEVVTNITTGAEQRTTAGQGGSQNPLLGPQRGRGPGGFPGGGGGGGRGGR